MKINYSKIQHHVEGQAPFTACVLTSKTDGEKAHNMEVGKLMRYILGDESNDGIVFQGNWSKQPLELLKMLEYCGKYNLGVVIHTDFDFESFKAHMGVASFQKVNKTILSIDEVAENMDKYILIGGMIMDYYVTDDYFIVAKGTVYQINKAKEEEKK